MTYEAFETRLDELSVVANARTLIDPEHPLEFFFGLSYGGAPILVVANAPHGCTKAFQETAGISINEKDTRNGTRQLTFECESEKMGDIFRRLCYDFVESTRQASDIEAGISILAQRFEDWCKMLRGRASSRLRDQQQRGLFAELLFLRDCLTTRGSFQATVSAWRGPNKGAQDFVFEDDWAEIKSISRTAKDVEISSLQQLALPMPGTLEIYIIVDGEPEDADAMTLPDMIKGLRDMLRTDEKAFAAFNEKLGLAGYFDSDAEAYSVARKLQEHVTFKVDDTFPRLTVEGVPLGIIEASYKLSLSVLRNRL